MAETTIHKYIVVADGTKCKRCVTKTDVLSEICEFLDDGHAKADIRVYGIDRAIPFKLNMEVVLDD